MTALPSAGRSLESLIQAHRILQFQWRAALTRTESDTQVLGALHRRVDAAMCAAVTARNNHRTCPPGTWKYELPRNPDEQARQLLAEHRRLVRQLPSIRKPVERQGDTEFARPRTDYENLIIETWDAGTSLPDGAELLLAEHIHDSVAHFTDWPCALYEQRGIFCDRSRYLAEVKSDLASFAT